MLDSTVVCRRALGCEWGVDRGWGEGAPQACRALWRAQGPK